MVTNDYPTAVEVAVVAALWAMVAVVAAVVFWGSRRELAKRGRKK
jgi:hypothetical protein